jgi:hypothetical protein
MALPEYDLEALAIFRMRAIRPKTTSEGDNVFIPEFTIIRPQTVTEPAKS